MKRPDLKDPGERLAYRRELQRVAFGVRMVGLGLLLLGAAIAFVRSQWLTTMPPWLPLAVIGCGLMLIVTAVSARTRYNSRRMRE